jgi:hypothetical protein
VRIADPTHPYRHGDIWLPLVVLFWWRLVAIGRWRDAIGFAGFLALQLLESFYSVLECAVFGSLWGVWAAWAHRRRLAYVAPKVTAAAVALLAWRLFSPYLATRAAWPALAQRGNYLNSPAAAWFGGMFYPGSVGVALAAIGLLDRAAHRVRGVWDPRWAIAAAGLATFLVSVGRFEIPYLGIAIPAPLGRRGVRPPDAGRADGRLAGVEGAGVRRGPLSAHPRASAAPGGGSRPATRSPSTSRAMRRRRRAATT